MKHNYIFLGVDIVCVVVFSSGAMMTTIYPTLTRAYKQCASARKKGCVAYVKRIQRYVTPCGKIKMREI